MNEIIAMIVCLIIIFAYRLLIPFLYVQSIKRYSIDDKLIRICSSQIVSYDPWRKFVYNRLNKDELIDLYYQKIIEDILTNENKVVNAEAIYTYEGDSITRIQMYNNLQTEAEYIGMNKKEKLKILNILFYNNNYYWEYSTDKYLFLTDYIYGPIIILDSQSLSKYKLISAVDKVV